MSRLSPKTKRVQKRCYFASQFLMLPGLTVGNHQHEKEGDAYTPLTICQQFYRSGSISPASESFDIDAQVDEGDVRVSRWVQALQRLHIWSCCFLSECLRIYPEPPFSTFTSNPLNFTLHFERCVLNIWPWSTKPDLYIIWRWIKNLSSDVWCVMIGQYL